MIVFTKWIKICCSIKKVKLEITWNKHKNQKKFIITSQFIYMTLSPKACNETRITERKWRYNPRTPYLSQVRYKMSFIKICWCGYYNIFIIHISKSLSSEAATQGSSLKKVFWKYAAELQESTHAEVWINKVALHWNRISAWVFSCKFAVYFQNTFSWEHLWVTAFVSCNDMSVCSTFFSRVVLINLWFNFVKPLLTRTH